MPEEQRVGKEMRVDSHTGLRAGLAHMIVWRLAGLEGKVTFLGPRSPAGSRDGIEFTMRREENWYLMKALMKLQIRSGDLIKAVAEGNDARVALGELENLFSIPNPSEEGTCDLAQVGPRGWMEVRGPSVSQAMSFRF
jgi:phosphotransferase system HPr-like phosphotransfer protein